MSRPTLVLSLSLLAALACTLTGTATPSASQVETEVAKLLTQNPASTLLPAATLAPVTALPVTALPASPVPATATLTPTATATSTATIAPSPTTPATDPRLNLGAPDWHDSFDTGQNWYLAGGNPQAEIRASKLVLSVAEADKRDWWRLAAPRLVNFYIEATARTTVCSGGDRYGIMVRAPDLNQGYLFGFTCDGRYSLRGWDGSEYTKLKDWSASPAIRAGPNQTNRLGFMADGSRLSLYANGTFLDEIRDDRYGEGRFGLFIMSNTTPNYAVEFDLLDYWNLP
jgi:hypothetical protein